MSSPSERNSKRRRSSLMASRKVRMDFSSGVAVAKGINSELPPDQRLQTLANTCLKFSASKLEENGLSDGYSDCLEEVMLRLPQMMDKEEFRNLFAAASQADTHSERTSECEEASMKQEILSKIKKLSAEEQDWKQLIADLEAQGRERAQQQKETLEERELSEEVRRLAKTYLCPMADLNSVQTDILTSLKRVALLVKEHDKTLYTLERSQTVLEDLLTKELHQDRGLMQEPVGSPRQVLQKVLDCQTSSSGEESNTMQ